MVWVVKLEEVLDGKVVSRRKVMTIDRPTVISNVTNYRRRQRDGLRAATSLVESSVNSLVNHRMNKRRQMRWSEHGAQQLLQVRTAVVTGEFERLSLPSEQAGVRDWIELAMAA